MNEPFSWLAVFSKLGIPGTAILAVVLGIVGAVGTNVGNVQERAAAFFNYERNTNNYYNNSDGNTTTNAPSVSQAHEHPEIDGRLTNLEQGQVDIYGRLTNLERGQADIYERLTNLEQGQVAIKADLGGVKADLVEVKNVLQKLLEKQ